MLALALAPLFFGLVDLPFQGLWAILLALSLAGADVSRLTREALGAMVAACLLFAFFVTAASAFWPKLLGAPIDPLWAQSSAVPGVAPAPSARALGHLSPTLLVPSLLVLLAFLRGVMLGCEPEGGLQLARTIGLAAAAFALFGLASMILDPGRLLWREKLAYAGNITGTFVNRNTAATFFGCATIILSLQIVIWLQAFFPEKVRPRDAVHLLLKERPRRLMLLACALVLTGGATLGTGSRAGLALTVLLTLLAVALHLGPARLVRAIRWKWLAIGAVLLLAVAEFWSLNTFDRFAQRGLGDSGRQLVFAQVVAMIAQRPLAGWGLGSFEMAFAAQRPARLPVAGVWDRAHSTPLELAFELGLPAAIPLCAAAVLLVGWLGWRAWRTRDQLVIIGFCVGLFGLLHSLVDFALQTPGYAIIWAALLGAACAHGATLRPAPSGGPIRDIPAS